MSTVLLMTDTWQPTVLRLVPFSNNNAKDSPRSSKNGFRKRGTNNSSNTRNFPVLAVTRTGGAGKAGRDPGRGLSARTYTSDSVGDNLSDTSCATPVGSANSARSQNTDDIDAQSGTTAKRYKKYAKKKIPEMRSEMKEAIKFSVQDINDQVSSSSSLHSGEGSDSTAKDKHSKVDNTRTRLPKPSMCHQQQDLKLYAPMNGIRRSVPLTPGELDLQKFRDSYNHEQSQKRKKYKLNVNQLPRSTTPINDHDPDKLNMKQVIAFLQTKASKDLQKTVVGNRTVNSHEYNIRRTNTFYRPLNTTTAAAAASRNMSNPSVGGANGPVSGEDKLDNTRLDNSGCVSVLSTKSTPNLSFGRQSNKNGKSFGSTRSMKSFKDDGSSRSSTLKERRPVKEFKLYRFLAVDPNGSRTSNKGLGTAVTEVDEGINMEVHNSLPPASPRRILPRRHRDSTTANLIHRHAINKNGVSTSMKNYMAKGKEFGESSKSIRLPSVNDEDAGGSDNESEVSCASTSATCNSTKNSSHKDERSKLPKKGKCITFMDERATDVDSESQTIIDGDINNNTTATTLNTVLNGYLTTMTKQPYKYSDVGKVRLSSEAPKQIHINMPNENKSYSQEIVRLTLRNDKNSTRVNSYMSDLQPPKIRSTSGTWHDVNWEESDEQGPLSERREWFESPRELINTITNNDFVRVRPKTKAAGNAGN